MADHPSSVRSADSLEQELVQLLVQESTLKDPLTVVTRVALLLSGVTGDTALRLLKKVQKSARFPLVVDAAAASGQLTVHAALMQLLPTGKTTLKLLGKK